MMFVLFSITFGSFIATYAVWWENGITCSTYLMSVCATIFDALVHSIFAIKYWVLSLKVKEIISEKKDKWL